MCFFNFTFKQKRGFSLLELMIVVAIIGILATTSIQGFRQYIVKSKKSEAFIGLSNIRTSQLSFYVENQRFANEGMAATAVMLSALLSGANLTSFPGEDWDEIGMPFPDKSMVRFAYYSIAGKYDAASSSWPALGSAATGFDTSYPVAPIDGDGDAECGILGGGSSSTLRISDMGAPASPTEDYDFFLSGAISPLAGGLTFSSLWGKECFFVLQLGQKISANDFSASPMIELNYN